jgi:hypothetical protein
LCFWNLSIRLGIQVWQNFNPAVAGNYSSKLSRPTIKPQPSNTTNAVINLSPWIQTWKHWAKYTMLWDFWKMARQVLLSKFFLRKSSKTQMKKQPSATAWNLSMANFFCFAKLTLETNSWVLTRLHSKRRRVARLAKP